MLVLHVRRGREAGLLLVLGRPPVTNGGDELVDPHARGRGEALLLAARRRLVHGGVGVVRVGRGSGRGGARVAHDVTVVVILAAALAAVVFPPGAALEGSGAGKGSESVTGLLSSKGAAKALDSVAVTP